MPIARGTAGSEEVLVWCGNPVNVVNEMLRRAHYVTRSLQRRHFLRNKRLSNGRLGCHFESK